MAEILTYANEEIVKSNYSDKLSFGIVLTGGGSQLKNIVDLGYLLGISIVGVLFLVVVLQFLFNSSNRNAKKLMRATLFYFPLMFILIILDALEII